MLLFIIQPSDKIINLNLLPTIWHISTRVLLRNLGDFMKPFICYSHPLYRSCLVSDYIIAVFVVSL